MLKTLLHWWRLLTEPRGNGAFGGPKRWRVRYRAGTTPMGFPQPEGTSIPMAYDSACNYAAMFDGTVERAQ